MTKKNEYVTRNSLEVWYPSCTLPKGWFRSVERRRRYGAK